MAYSPLTACSPDNSLRSAGVRSQPVHQIAWASEIEQGIGQSFQLRQGQTCPGCGRWWGIAALDQEGVGEILASGA